MSTSTRHPEPESEAPVGRIDAPPGADAGADPGVDGGAGALSDTGAGAGAGADPGVGDRTDATAHAQAAEQAEDRKLLRLAAVTTGWWAHGLLRLLLAVAMVYYGSAKLVLGQFGVADMGDALIMQGEMSPMGMLWRMVAFSPLFQFLAGLVEFTAGVALLWRRTVPLGALLAFTSMALVFVLNLGYDVPVKQLSLALALISLIVLAPWMARIARAILGHGEISPGPRPTLVPWRPASRITDIAGPLAAIGLVALLSWAMAGTYSERGQDASAPAGVWTVASDSAAPAPQLAEDTRWQQVAFGEVTYEGLSSAQVRLANGDLLRGTYERIDDSTVAMSLRPLREQGQSLREYQETEPLELTLSLEEQPDGTLQVTGDGQDLVLADDPSATVLYDREPAWGSRPDAPFNR